MEIETEFALFSKRLKLSTLDPSALALLAEQSAAPPSTEQVEQLVIPRRDPRFATSREIRAFVADNKDHVTEEDLKVLHVQKLHDEILSEKRRSRRPMQHQSLEMMEEISKKVFQPGCNHFTSAFRRLLNFPTCRSKTLSTETG